ncbi:MAG TPA: hypothetical protein VN380_17005 [Thermoanaerobaculia bacterium]|nr:hypothetical protein [Thermoanaerobaculia bacterium]
MPYAQSFLRELLPLLLLAAAGLAVELDRLEGQRAPSRFQRVDWAG